MAAPRVAVDLPSIEDRWLAAARLVAESRDVLDGRPGGRGGELPEAIVARGWAPFLLSLDDAELDMLEIAGLAAVWPVRAPATLRTLAARAQGVCSLPSFTSPAASEVALRRGETPRKHAQIEAFGHLVAPLAARAGRVVDVGSGHGHLTREVARRSSAPVVGLERDAALAGRARALSTSSAPPTFAVADVLGEGLALRAGDCVIGLHACGELGDVMVESVARTPGATLVLVGCCLQKRRGPSRRALCAPDGLAKALDLPRGLLGLSNLAASDEGVEATRARNLVARERRLALNHLLSDGAPLRLGAELAGLNRRTAHLELPELAERAFAVRGWPAPSPQAVAGAAAWARVAHSRARRLSVPRAMLARVLEVYVLLDRAVHLEEHGLTAELGELFPARVSPRNLALVATPGAAGGARPTPT